MRQTWRPGGFERSTVVEAAGSFLATKLGLRIFGFHRWKKALAWLVPGMNADTGVIGPGEVTSAQKIAQIAAAVERNFFFRTNCLEQALVLWFLLRRRGIAAELCFGGRKEGSRFEAHAWVEIGGTVLEKTGEAHHHFVPFEGPLLKGKTHNE